MARGNVYQDRYAAGRVLAQHLGRHGGRAGLLVFGLPRGGVPVAFEVAQALRAHLDVFVVRKLGVPGHEELAMGAIATGGIRLLNKDVIDALDIPPQVVAEVTNAEERELARRERLYRDALPAPQLRGRQVILVDDGLATGATMSAAIAAVRRQGVARVIVAVPVAAPATCQQLSRSVDEIVCGLTPEPFYAVGLWYQDFRPTTDDEVRELLAQSQRREAGNAGDGEQQRMVDDGGGTRA